MKTVTEVSRISGVSVRTLHYYDNIGLLKPTALTDAGYRLYDDEAIARLQTILMFRELAFPLKEIKNILDSPDFDLKTAFRQHIKLLQLQKEHLEELLRLANKMIEQGADFMDFSAFDKSKITDYEKEVAEHWGKTDAYKEYTEKSKNMTAEQKRNSENGLMQQFAVFGELKAKSADSVEVQSAVKNLRQFITDNFYNCTKEILLCLGDMYISDERFKSNIDSVGGAGTAEFVQKAIKIYCA